MKFDPYFRSKDHTQACVTRYFIHSTADSEISTRSEILRATMKEIFRFALAILLVFIAKLSEGQILRASTINIAAGKPITATSTCGVGLNEPELYCKLASVPGKFGIEGLKCDRCDPTNYIKDRDIKFAVDGSERWWQSPPLSRGLDFQKVNITIDLQQVSA